MATLSGNTISDTYDGLLKLQDSSLPISSGMTQITDGLGNPTGLRLSDTEAQIFNGFTFKTYGLPKYVGMGFSNSSSFSSNFSQRTTSQPVLLRGELSYSGITYRMITPTSSNDTISFSLYEADYDDSVGVYPKTRVVNNLPLILTGSTSNISIPFGFNISVSESSIYFILLTGDNGNSPGTLLTARLGQVIGQTNLNLLNMIYGATITQNGQFGLFPTTSHSTVNLAQLYNGTFGATITPAQLIAAENSSGTQANGFLFNVVR
jgi:hypothetical protein